MTLSCASWFGTTSGFPRVCNFPLTSGLFTPEVFMAAVRRIVPTSQLRPMRTFGVLLLIAFVAGQAVAQPSVFEAASVKRRTEPGGGFMGRQPGGRFTAQGVSLQDLIVFAYGMQPYQIVDGPQWLDTERWDVTATGAP